MSIGFGTKIYLCGAKPNTHTWWLQPSTSSLRSWLQFGAFFVFPPLPWEVSHVWSYGCFEFFNHEQLVPLSANLLSQAFPPRKKQENNPNLQHNIKILF
jgi:hypothetical protein